MAPTTICIEGTKGAGKTTTIAGLVQRLEQDGHAVVVCAPFAEANLFAQIRGFTGAVQMIGASKEDNKAEIDFILSTVAEARKKAEQLAVDEKNPVALIYDRGWITILPHLFGGRWAFEDGADSESIREIWEKVLAEAPPTVFLHAAFEVTKQRRPHGSLTSGLDTDAKLREDIEGRTAFAAAHSDKIVLSFDTGQTPRTEIVDAIATHIRNDTTLKRDAAIAAPSP